MDSKGCVYIDPGHGGMDGGSISDGVVEKDLNLEVSKKLYNVFKDNGYEVFLTRDGDYDLADDPNHRKRSDLAKRVSMINSSGAILFISIHMNMYSNEKYRGAQVFYSDRNEYNSVIAKSIQNSLSKVLKNTNRMSKEVSGKYLLDNVMVNGCLVECGFLSNNEERKELCDSNYQNVLAKAIYLGLIDYLNIYE